MANFLAPADLSKAFVGISEKKASIPAAKMLVLGILAGVYIGFAAHVATTIATGPEDWFGVKKFLIGAVFSCGLMLVIIPGSELWTGNNLMVIGLLDKKIGFGGLMKNWGLVYLGNLIGSLLLAFIIAQSSGLLAGNIGATAIKIAAGKVSVSTIGDMSHNYAFFFRAVGCNWLVCLAVMMAISAQDIAGKVLAIFFPIMAFVAAGFEHCIANMYFIPLAILAAADPALLQAAGVAADGLDGAGMVRNLVPVTLGNIVGGGVFVALTYYVVYLRGHD